MQLGRHRVATKWTQGCNYGTVVRHYGARQDILSYDVLIKIFFVHLNGLGLIFLVVYIIYAIYVHLSLEDTSAYQFGNTNFRQSVAIVS